MAELVHIEPDLVTLEPEPAPMVAEVELAASIGATEHMAIVVEPQSPTMAATAPTVPHVDINTATTTTMPTHSSANTTTATNATTTASNNNTDELNFMSDEKLPDSWPDEFPGITKFPAAQASSNLQFDSSDIVLVNSLGNLAPGALFDEMKAMHAIACRLAVEENQEKTRGKILRVLLD